MATTSSMLLILIAILSSGFFSNTGYSFSIKEATISDIKLAFNQNQLSSRELIDLYQRDYKTLRLNLFLIAVIEVNPDALNQADMAGNDRKAGTPGSQDSIVTKEMLNITAGSFSCTAWLNRA
ncbi:putative amidase [Quercus suber]|uniref:Amidase n=1 Tax=Quercus suber TaxID=58331 RepID=A0AAW0IX20_QUESU